MIKPSVFIGYSSEGMEIARAVRSLLTQDTEVTMWNGGNFSLGYIFIESLVNSLPRFDFAILVLTPDDLENRRNAESFGPRDNVLFELGLFMGRLGRSRTYILYQADARLKIPTDLAGVTMATYEWPRTDRNYRAAVGDACDSIRQTIRDLGAALEAVRADEPRAIVLNHELEEALKRSEAHAKGLQEELTTTTQQMKALKESYERDKQQVTKLEQKLIIASRQSTDLESALQRAEAQITQLQSVAATRGQRIFIGHGRSPLWRELKDFIAERLKLPWEEFNREAVAGYTTAERLESMLSQAAFAFLIMTAEEEHGDTTLHARPNVIHEVGLFQGHLSLRHAIVMVEEGCSEFSNIIGLSQIRFPRGDISARFEEVRRVLEREKLV